jgi:hypothetical protein
MHYTWGRGASGPFHRTVKPIEACGQGVAIAAVCGWHGPVAEIRFGPANGEAKRFFREEVNNICARCA